MDKRVIFAVAGSGKTTHVVNNLSKDRRSLIITYTNGNYNNLRKKILDKFNNTWPDNIVLMTYFSFLFRFCYKPFLSDSYRANGIIFEPNKNKFAKQSTINYFMTDNKFLYSNRLALLLEKNKIIDDISSRLEKYFDEFIIDEIQDIAGRDFVFLESLMATNINMLFVGDFYQHTFDTSRDGNFNNTLFDDKTTYETRFKNKGFSIDNAKLTNSWRCSQNVCDYIRNNLHIDIYSNRNETDNSIIEFITDKKIIDSIFSNSDIIKLHYRNGAKFGINHKNWGDTKGEDHHRDVCVLLNKTTASKHETGKLVELAPSTKNKLYVAITRARGNVYLVNE